MNYPELHEVESLRQKANDLFREKLYDEAIKTCIEIYQISARVLDSNPELSHDLAIFSIGGLAEIYRTIGKYNEAEPLYKKVLEILRTQKTDNHDDTLFYLNNLAKTCWEMGNLVEAGSYYQQVLKIQREVFGEEHSEVLSSLNRIGLLYNEAENYSEAVVYLQKALDVAWKVDNGKFSNVVIILKNLALSQKNLGDFFGAESSYKLALEIKRNTADENKIEIVNILEKLGLVYQTNKIFSLAISSFQEALKIRSELLGVEHLENLDDLKKMGELYILNNERQKAIPFYQQSLILAKKHFGKDHSEIIEMLYKLADLYVSMAKYEEAEPLYKDILEYGKACEEKLGYASALTIVAQFYRNSGKYLSAEPLYRESLEIKKNILGEHHPDVASAIFLLANLHSDMGNYEAAESLYLQGINIPSANNKEDWVVRARITSRLAGLYVEIGKKTKEAKSLYQNALETQKEILGENHPHYVETLSGLARLYFTKRDYKRAIVLYQQVFELTQLIYGEESPDFATALHCLALLHTTIGNNYTAEEYCQRALDITKITQGENHLNFAKSLMIQAEINRKAGKYQLLEPIYNKALEIIKNTLGEKNFEFANVLEELAFFYMATNNYDLAEETLKKVVEIKLECTGRNSGEFSRSLHILAILYWQVGDAISAASLVHESLSILSDISIDEYYDVYYERLGLLGILYASIGEYEEAIDVIKRSEKRKNIEQVIKICSENGRLRSQKLERYDLSWMLSLINNVFKSSNHEVCLGLDLVLRRKGLGVEASYLQRKALLNICNPELKNCVSELNRLKNNWGRKMIAGPGLEDLNSYRQQLLEWRNRIELLEAEIASQVPEVDIPKPILVAASDLNFIAETLPEASALIEFVYFDDYNFKAVQARGEEIYKPARYVAFVLHAGKPDQVQLIDLDEADPINQLVKVFREFVTYEKEEGNRSLNVRDTRFLGSPTTLLYAGWTLPAKLNSALNDETFAQGNKETVNRLARPETPVSFPLIDNGLELRAKIFDPLLPAIGNCKRLFIAPDGDLSRLPFEVLPTDDGQRLIDHYTISYLSTGRDVLRFGAPSTGEPTPPIVAADPDFDLEGNAPIAEPSPGPEYSTSADDSNRSISHSRISRDFDRGIHFGRLKGTRTEGERVAELLGVKPLLGAEVRETPLKACRSPQILHIATHGFFLENQKQDPNEDKLGAMGMMDISPEGSIGRLSAAHIENPLLRSGLALAGANTWLKDDTLPEDAEDAILTAEDVTAMDLLSTEMVVLSACETGLGEVQTGEGVFGLRRSFILAGAKTLVMSLWKVPDKQTQELMEDFYKRILAGQPRAEALRGAQLEMKKKYPDPLYWGAFICQGDPNPLNKLAV